MPNITKVEFVAVDILGKNYLSWILDVKIHLSVMNLTNTIKKENIAPLKDCTKTLIFLRHHVDEGLKSDYLTIKDPLIL